MNIDKPYVIACFSVGVGKEVSHFFPRDEALDRAIIQTMNHLQDSGFVVSELRIGNQGVTISHAAIETIMTLSEKQAIGWISAVRRAAE